MPFWRKRGYIFLVIHPTQIQRLNLGGFVRYRPRQHAFSACSDVSVPRQGQSVVVARAFRVSVLGEGGALREFGRNRILLNETSEPSSGATVKPRDQVGAKAKLAFLVGRHEKSDQRRSRAVVVNQIRFTHVIQLLLINVYD